MPAKSPPIPPVVHDKLTAMGKQIRIRRKELRVSATVAAEAAGMSRVTLHRIENGEAAVTMGAYLNAMDALGIECGIIGAPGPDVKAAEDGHKGWIPARVRLSDYPQLKRLAWQVHGIEELTPAEALGIYERNWRHVDMQALEPHERQLVDALRLALGEPGTHV